MKKFKLIILTLLFPVLGIAQTEVDSILFQMVNHLRDSVGLPKIKWDTNIYKAAEHHSQYLLKIPEVFIQDSEDTNKFQGKYTPGTHTEDMQFEGFQDIKTVEDRIKKYAPGMIAPLSCENVYVLGGKMFSKLDVQRTASFIFAAWLKSPAHKANMLNKDMTYGACCAYFDKIPNITQYLDGRKRTVMLFYMAATMDMSKN